MRKIIGLCILTATLFASSAQAQSIFIDKGDPSAMDVTLGGGLGKDAWGAGVAGGYSYRGVFDVGLGFTRYAYTGGSDKNLAGYDIAPFMNWHILRHDVDELPVSISAQIGVHRNLYMGNGPVASPNGWGLYAGPSVYRRFEFGTSLVFVPEVLVAYDFEYIQRFSRAANQTSGNGNADAGNGYSTVATHSVRALVRPNVLYKMGNTNYVLTPYAGYQDGFAFGGNVGAIF